MSALARLLEQATRDCECGHPVAEHDQHGCIHIGAEHCDRKGDDSWEQLAALAPDMARLLIDMAAWAQNVQDEALRDREPDYERMEALLARFAELEQRAAP